MAAAERRYLPTFLSRRGFESFKKTANDRPSNEVEEMSFISGYDAPL